MTPTKPTIAETPTFATAKRKSREVMKRCDLPYLEVWVLYADDTVGLHRFNRNGSHRRGEVEMSQVKENLK